MKLSLESEFWKYDPPFWKSIPNDKHVGYEESSSWADTNRAPRATRLNHDKEDMAKIY